MEDVKEERTEMERLLKEMEEKDLLLAEYKKREEESRAEAARLRSDFDDMKEFCDSFREEIEKLLVDEEISCSEHDQIMALYGRWHAYKVDAFRYRDSLKNARGCVHILKNDLKKLEGMFKKVSPSAAQARDRITVMRRHLEALNRKLKE